MGERELRRAIGSECQDPINLVTISSPCQGFSRANRQALGLEDERSCLILEAWRILDLLQRMQRPSRGSMWGSSLRWWMRQTTLLLRRVGGSSR